MSHFRKVWHPYWTWEDFKAGMWRQIATDERSKMLPIAIEFTGNAQRYGSFMQRIIREWPISCEHNLTDIHMNRLAWIGHAATCLAINAPEYVTRAAWRYLSQQQMDDANKEAERALRDWRGFYRERQNRAVDSEMGRQGILEWNS